MEQTTLEFDLDQNPLSASVRRENGELSCDGIAAIERFAEILRQKGFAVEVSRGKVWDTARMTVSSPGDEEAKNAVAPEIDSLIDKWKQTRYEMSHWAVGQGRLHIYEDFIKDLEALRAKCS